MGRDGYLLAYETIPFQLQVYVNVSNDSLEAGITILSSSTNALICTTYTSEASTTKSHESLNTAPKSSIDETTLLYNSGGSRQVSIVSVETPFWQT